MNYKIYPIQLSGVNVDGSSILYRLPIGTQYRMVMGAFVLEDENGEFILVDTGLPSLRENEENNYGFRKMDESVEYIDELRKLGVDPEAVKLIILTHLHFDHSWNLQYFPNAQIIVQKRELHYAVDPMPNQRKSYALTKEAVGKSWLQAILQIKTVDGDVEIRPGLSVITTPGHTPGSQTVLVDTKDGMYALVNDIGMSFDNFTRAVPTASVHNQEEWYYSHAKVMKLNAKLLPTHEPSIYDTKVYG